MGVGGGRGHSSTLRRRTGKDGQHLVALAAIVFIPGQDQQALVHRAGRRIEDGRQVALQPVVSGGHRAIVHVVAQVRRDEGKIRGVRGGGQVR